MPKVKNLKKKRAQRKPPPTGAVHTLEELEDAVDGDEMEELVDSEPVLQRLTSTEPEDRECACSDIANIVLEDPATIKTIVEQDGLKKLVQNMCDPVIRVRIAAAGALRNMTNVGGSEIAELLVQKDCMTPISAMLQQTYESTKTLQDKSGEEKKYIYNLLTQIIHLLSNISENSETATQMFTSSKAVLFVMSFLKQEEFPLELKVGAAQLLNVVSDENVEIAQQILSSPEHTQLLQSLINEDKIHIILRVLASGIAYNIRTPQTRAFIVKSVLPVLSTSIEYDTITNLMKFEAYFSTLDAEDGPKAEPTNINEAEREYIGWKYCVEAQQTSLEILANICTEDEETASDENTVNIPQDIIQLVAGSQLFPKVLSRCGYLTPEIIQKLSAHTFITIDNFHSIQLSALTCIGNMLFMFPKIDDAANLWNHLCQLCIEQASVEILESVTSAMWTILRKCGQPLSFFPTTAHIETLFKLTKSGASEEIRMSGAGMIGIIGQHPSAVPGIANICELLIACLGDSAPSVVAEALNSIFDIFAETQYNEVVVKLGLMNHLQNCYKMVGGALHTKTVKLDKDLYIRLEEAHENLGNFLQYKSNQFK